MFEGSNCGVAHSPIGVTAGRIVKNFSSLMHGVKPIGYPQIKRRNDTMKRITNFIWHELLLIFKKHSRPQSYQKKLNLSTVATRFTLGKLGKVDRFNFLRYDWGRLCFLKIRSNTCQI